jgi:YspA, cpYpsA-related SLOG family
MRVIVAGSRTIRDYALVCKAIADSGFNVESVVSGCAKGVDTLGERWAEERSVSVSKFPAAWDQYGPLAGPLRNQQMAEHADALVAVMVEEGSKGTQDMIRRAKKCGLKVHILLV